MQDEFPPEPENPPPTTEPEADAQTVQDITERLNEITRRGKRAKHLTALGFIVTFASQISALFIVLSFHDPRNWRGGIVFLLMLIGSFGGLGLAIWASCRAQVTFDGLKMARLGEVQSVAPLFAALEGTQLKSEKAAIRSALTTLLPRMKSSDANLLTPTAHRVINGWLLTAFDRSAGNACPASLVLATLKALEPVGDSRNMFFVDQVANWKPRTLEDTEIRQAARECLPMLRANCGNVETARTPLRASQAQIQAPEMRLRWAPGPGEDAPQELLRVASEPPPKPAPPPGPA